VCREQPSRHVPQPRVQRTCRYIPKAVCTISWKISRKIHSKAYKLSPTCRFSVIDHPFEVVITTQSDSTDLIIEGSPTVLNCDVTPSFYSQFLRVVTWKTIDPFGHETEITRDDNRY